MPLVSTKTLLNIAEEKNFALPAFNIPIPEFILWILEEAETLRAPVIIQVAPVEYKALHIAMFRGTLLSLSEHFSVPFSLHLDHAHREEEVLLAIQNGFSSVMIDGSRLPFPENVRLTKGIVDLAHPVQVLVEGELGRVGGLEGDEIWEKEANEDEFFTSPEEAEQFVQEVPVGYVSGGGGYSSRSLRRPGAQIAIRTHRAHLPKNTSPLGPPRGNRYPHRRFAGSKPKRGEKN